MEKKAKVYIDGANMFSAQKKLGWSLDWSAVKAYVRENFATQDMKYYTGIKKDDEKMARYLRYLDKIGFTVATKPLRALPKITSPDSVSNFSKIRFFLTEKILRCSSSCSERFLTEEKPEIGKIWRRDGGVIFGRALKVIRIDDDHPSSKLYNYREIYKSNFDVEITADMIFDRMQVEEFVLFSGDSDFEYVVRRLKDVGKRVVVFSSRRLSHGN